MADDEKPPWETPWGTERDEPDKCFGGFWWVHTSRHGGLYLTPEQQEAIPESLKAHSKNGTGVWWEENTAWSLPVICLLSKRPEASLTEEEQETLDRAHNTAQDEYPDEWEHLTGRKIEPGQSQARDENLPPSPWTSDWKEALAKEAEAERIKPESKLQPERARPSPSEDHNAPEKLSHRLDRLIGEQDRIARAKEEQLRTERPKDRERER